MSATLSTGRSLRECTVAVTPRSFGLHDPGLRAELEQQVETVRYRPGPLTASELIDVVGDADGLLAGVDTIDATVFGQAPRLRVVARYGVGVDRVDLDAARRYGVVVTTTPGANANAVAELTIALLFALARPAIRSARADAWQAQAGVELEGRTLGLVGLGRIGRRVAEKGRALGMHVIAHDPNVGGTVSLQTLQDEADFVSLHAPLTDATRGLVDRSFLERLKPGASLINTARGELVDEQALLWALDAGRLHAAALDVLAEEPPPADHPLLGREDVVLTPHAGPHTLEATNAMGRIALDELLAVLSGREPRYPA
jgi:phosphoglycerate dehydrogenase-like enzyme